MSDPSPANGPFAAALGRAIEGLAPAVGRHLVPSTARSAHRGTLRRIWHRSPAGWVAARLLGLRGDARSPFDLENELVDDGDGGPAMTWRRAHSGGAGAIRGVGIVSWKPSDGVLVDQVGAPRWLEVELVPRVEDGALEMSSARQWIRLGRLRVRLPRWIFGSAETREWQEEDGRVGLSLTLRHPLFGSYAGYEAVLSPLERS